MARLHLAALPHFPLVVLMASQMAVGLAAQRPPNIVFILADDLGYGDLGSYGQERLRTPHLDQLAKEGRRYTQFYAGSTVCAPSRCVLMTGRHTGHCYIRGNGKMNLRPEDVTIAEVLKGAGYATGLYGKWGIGHEGSDGLPTKQGFDAFYGYLDQHHAHNYWPTFLVDGDARVKLRNVVPKEGKWGQGEATTKRDYSHDLIADRALAFVEANRDRPFFLYLALTIPHANNEARKTHGMEVPDYGSFADTDWPDQEKGFAAMVERMDRDVGRLMTKLKQLGIDEDTVVMFSSDNGPHREGKHKPDFFGSRGPLQGTKRSLTEGGIRVPMIARWPGKIPAGTTSDHQGAFWDLMPTYAELAGMVDAIPTNCDGLSFVPSLLGRDGEQRKHDYLYWAFYEGGSAQAVRFGNWKAVQQPYSTPVRLYDLSADLGEENDLAKANPDVVARAEKLMAGAYAPSDRWKFKTKPRRRR